VRLFNPTAGTVIVVPSLTVPVDELRKLTGMHHYEERLLFLLLTLRSPDVRMVYLSSVAIDEVIVDHYLGLLPDPAGARERLLLCSLDDPSPRPLTDKLLAHPEVIGQLRRLELDPCGSWVLPFIATEREHRFADLLGLPLYGPSPELAALGSKSGSRQLAQEACIPVPNGRSDLWSLAEVEAAAQSLSGPDGAPPRALIKLNDSFSGLGNVAVEIPAPGAPITEARTEFSAPGESWPSFARKIAERGAVVEELLSGAEMASPSVLVEVSAGGGVEVVATHDQILGGPTDQVYLGCRFPAALAYRADIQEAAEQVAKVLAARGVMGLFGIDFLVLRSPGAGHRIFLSEVNLRLGGTTHPFGTALLATNGSYERATGRLLAGGRAKSYLATDNHVSEHLLGTSPGKVLAELERRGLLFAPQPGPATGVVLHMLGALPRLGKVGFTCIGDSPEEAAALYQRTVDALASL
jgi:hypothetical protein